MTEREALQKAIEVVGSQTELARRCTDIGPKQYQQGHVGYWLRAGRVSPPAAIVIEKATDGQVTRHDLRPDLYPREAA